MPRSFGESAFTRLPPMYMSPEVMSSEPRDEAQQGGLAAARRADEDDELAVLDVEIDAVD